MMMMGSWRKKAGWWMQGWLVMAVCMGLSKETYLRVATEAVEEAERLTATVDTSCRLEIIGSTTKGDHHQHDVRLVTRGDAPADAPKVCVVNGTREDHKEVAVLMMVNTVEYLKRRGNWEAFVNKVAYCRATKRALYVWIGDLAPEVLNARHEVPWMACAETPAKNTLNVYKTVAFLATFERRRKETGRRRSPPVLYLDADAWFSDVAFENTATPEAYLNVSQRAYLMANQNRIGGPKIPVNGGLLAVRDQARAKRFLALWLYSRCGPHDQLPLWATLFASWAVDAGESLPTGLFSKYSVAQPRAVAELAHHLQAFRKPLLDRDPSNTFDGGSFHKTHLLDKPLELPGVLLLPSAPLANAKLPALRSDANPRGRTFCCHTRIDKDELDGQCRGADVCSNRKCFPYVPDDRGPRWSSSSFFGDAVTAFFSWFSLSGGGSSSSSSSSSSHARGRDVLSSAPSSSSSSEKKTTTGGGGGPNDDDDLGSRRSRWRRQSRRFLRSLSSSSPGVRASS